MGGGADQDAVCVQHQRVAAIEYGERRKRVQARIESADAGRGGVERTLQGTIQAGAAGGEALAGKAKSTARIVAQNRRGEIGDAALMPAELGGKGGFLAEGELVQALLQAMKQRGHARLGTA